MNAIVVTTTKTHRLHLFVTGIADTQTALTLASQYTHEKNLVGEGEIVNMMAVVSEGDIELVYLEELRRDKSPETCLENAR